MAAPTFGDALRARMIALGADATAAQALQEGSASAVPGTRGVAALDAAIRSLSAAPASPGAAALLPAAYALRARQSLRRCRARRRPSSRSVQPAPKGPEDEAQVRVRGAVLLAIAGRAPTADAAKGKPEGP